MTNKNIRAGAQTLGTLCLCAIIAACARTDDPGTADPNANQGPGASTDFADIRVDAAGLVVEYSNAEARMSARADTLAFVRVDGFVLRTVAPRAVEPRNEGNATVFEDLYGEGVHLRYEAGEGILYRHVIIDDLAALNALEPPAGTAFVEVREAIRLGDDLVVWGRAEGAPAKDAAHASLVTAGEVNFGYGFDDVRFEVPVPNAWDSAATDRAADPLMRSTWRTTGQGRGLFAARLPMAWLTDTARVYPVTIDPTFRDSLSDPILDLGWGNTSPGSLEIHVVATFLGANSAPTGMNITIDWGDSTTTNLGPQVGPLQQPHAYASAGTYTVEVKICETAAPTVCTSGVFDILAGGSCADADGDLHLDVACGGYDCNDADGAINPSAPDICGDLVDNDCDGEIDEACDGEVVGNVPCTGDNHTISPSVVDMYRISGLSPGDVVQIHVDTRNVSNTFDPITYLWPVLSGPPYNLGEALPITESGGDWDDDVDCTFPPPNWQCPNNSYTTPIGGDLNFSVGEYGTGTECVSGTTGEYVVTVQINGTVLPDSLLAMPCDDCVVEPEN